MAADRNPPTRSAEELPAPSEGQQTAERRQERDDWLSQWSNIWTNRQSPDWRPRRASVASCQLKQMVSIEREPCRALTNSDFGKFLSVNPQPRRNLVAKRRNIQQPQLAPTSAVKSDINKRNTSPPIKVDELKSDSCLAMASQGATDGSSSGSSSVSNNQAQSDDLGLPACAGVRQQPDSGEANKLSLDLTLSGSTATLVAPTADAARMTARVQQLNRSDSHLPSLPTEESLVRQQQQQQQQATCCPAAPLDGCLEEQNQLEMQDKQRKFLILSMALKQMISDGSLSAANKTSQDNDDEGDDGEQRRCCNNCRCCNGQSNSCSSCFRWQVVAAKQHSRQTRTSGSKKAANKQQPSVFKISLQSDSMQVLDSSRSELIDRLLESPSDSAAIGAGCELTTTAPDQSAAHQTSAGNTASSDSSSWRTTKPNSQTTTSSSNRQRKRAIALLRESGSSPSLTRSADSAEPLGCPSLQPIDTSSRLRTVKERVSLPESSITAALEAKTTSTTTTTNTSKQPTAGSPSGRHSYLSYHLASRAADEASAVATATTNRTNSELGSEQIPACANNKMTPSEANPTTVRAFSESPQQQQAKRTSLLPDRAENVCEVDLESLIVESWLDDHPAFVHDYFMRKANKQLIDDWLISNAKVSNTNLSSQFELSSGNRILSRHVSQQSLNSHLHNLGLRAESDPPTVTKTMLEQSARAVSSLGSSSASFRPARSQSGTATPVRKISATDFESRTGSSFLRPMVSTTPDGRPTFLSQQLSVEEVEWSNDDSNASGINLINKRHQQQQSQQKQQRQSNSTDSTPTHIIADKPTGSGNGNSLCDSDDEDEDDKEVKLIFELVKNICNDLDIRTLLHKILKNISVLINADKSSLFLVCGESGDPNRRLVSQLFNVDQDSEISQLADCITIPWGTGLVGYVAESGESVNIENCYDDPRFTNTIDQHTGYVTKHMLCAPIFDKRNEIVGVAQVINKRDGNPFSKSDEIKFKRYLQFCGIGLRNAQSYEHCQLENRRNQVLLDLARMVFEEQSTIEQVVYRIMLHTQSLLECQRCQVLLIDNGSDDLDQLLQLPHAFNLRKQQGAGSGNGNDNGAPDVAGRPPKPEWRPHCRMASLAFEQTTEPRNCLGLQSSSGDSTSLASDNDHHDQRGQLETADNDDHSPQSRGSLLAEDSMASSSPKQSVKLFSLVFDLECERSDLVMHNCKEEPQSQQQQQHSQAKSTSKPTNNNKNRKFPINIGITGYVAMTGETLNIEDAHQSERFDPSVDEGSDFKHKSILCMPIRNGQRQIIGVSQLINKKDGRPFNKNDEDLFEAFAIFCGLGIHNTLMYEKVLKIMAKQRVTFEVLSYHATAPLEEAKKLNMEQIPSCFALNLTSLKFNDFSLDEQFMLKSCLRFFLDLDLIRRFQIDQLVFCNWILSVQKNYRKVTYHPIVGGNGLKAAPVRYHNWRHAFNVSQMMFAILVNTQICQALGELETLALLIACLCHDLDHRGTNNSFQIKSASPLAELYSTSTMEHHHFDQCIMILNSQGNRILANLSPEEYSRVIVLLEEAILATDLAKYFQKRDLFFQLVNDNQFDWQNNLKHRSLLRCMLMTACDVAAITKPWPVQKVVADLVMSEFYQQGDIEKQELNIEPIDMMNREKMSKLPEMQIGFIDSICAPIYTAFAKLFPQELDPLLDGCLSNRKIWAELAKNNDSKLASSHSSYLKTSHINNNNDNINNNNNNNAAITTLPKSNTSPTTEKVELETNQSLGEDLSLIPNDNLGTNNECKLTGVGCQRKSV